MIDGIYDPTAAEACEATPYTLRMSDGGSSEQVEFDERPTEAEIEEACEEWVEGGDWGDDGAAVDVEWTLMRGDDDIDSGSVTVTVEPNHAELIRAAGGDADCDHDWTSDGEGGCTENPGVWSTGGTRMVFCSHCRRCGLRRIERTTGSQHNPGEHDTVEYQLLDDDEIAAHIEAGHMDPRD